jgi:DNA-binding transcriptional MerR regulator
MKAAGGNGSLSSGELADLAGVSRDTLRHYERKGVLPRPLRGHNSYRQYPPEALQRVQLVRRALSVGFTLDELAKVLKVRDAGGAPCEEVRRLAAQKLLNVQDQLRELTELRDELQKTLRDWDSRLSRRAVGKRANLLESLSVKPKPAARSPIKGKRRSE